MQIVSLETICIICQILFSWKKKKNSISFLSAEFAQREEKVKVQTLNTWSVENTTFSQGPVEIIRLVAYLCPFKIILFLFVKLNGRRKLNLISANGTTWTTHARTHPLHLSR